MTLRKPDLRTCATGGLHRPKRGGLVRTSCCAAKLNQERASVVYCVWRVGELAPLDSTGKK